jgi:hypothetical protein
MRSVPCVPTNNNIVGIYARSSINYCKTRMLKDNWNHFFVKINSNSLFDNGNTKKDPT